MIRRTSTGSACSTGWRCWREVFGFEAAFGPGEGRHGAGDGGEFRAANVGQGDGGKRVEDVVAAWDAELDIAEALTVFLKAEGRAAFEVPHFTCGVVGVLPSIGYDMVAGLAEFACREFARAELVVQLGDREGRAAQPVLVGGSPMTPTIPT